MAGSDRLPPGSLSDFGLDLSGHHPVSFPYHDALPNPELQSSPPPDLVYGGSDEVHCITCHDPHKDLYGKFLLKDNRYSALCDTCHQLTGWPASAHATSTEPVGGILPRPPKTWPTLDPDERVGLRGLPHAPFRPDGAAAPELHVPPPGSLLVHQRGMPFGGAGAAPRGGARGRDGGRTAGARPCSTAWPTSPVRSARSPPTTSSRRSPRRAPRGSSAILRRIRPGRGLLRLSQSARRQRGHGTGAVRVGDAPGRERRRPQRRDRPVVDLPVRDLLQVPRGLHAGHGVHSPLHRHHEQAAGVRDDEPLVPSGSGRGPEPERPEHSVRLRAFDDRDRPDLLHGLPRRRSEGLPGAARIGLRSHPEGTVRDGGQHARELRQLRPLLPLPRQEPDPGRHELPEGREAAAGQHVGGRAQRAPGGGGALLGLPRPARRERFRRGGPAR